ncbi:unnamed protein product [Strongylus vulgaris]|uniref:Uncharacterized protein n=1 Tax=Strongylus vulgaris TaxID=40348 RepID=A0A3P7IFX8_STRVU|nr:unnamed protein product [Strongylus vulgaris]
MIGGRSEKDAGRRFGGAKKEETCNRGASYNKKKGRCECDNPEADAKIANPEKYGHYPPGTICFDCGKVKEGRSLVFLLDSTGSVGQEGYDKDFNDRCIQQINFMKMIVKNIKQIRTGIVKVIQIPIVSLEMGQHTPDQLKYADFHLLVIFTHVVPQDFIILLLNDSH